MSSLADSPLAMLSIIAVLVARNDGAVTITQDEMSEAAAAFNLHNRINEDGGIELVLSQRIVVPANDVN